MLSKPGEVKLFLPQGAQASSLSLTLHNTTLSGLPKDIFHRVGNVYNLSISIDSNNKKINTIPNPHSALHPNMPGKVFLTKLSVHFMTVMCDCDIGWVEYWERRKRQHFCSDLEWPEETAVKGQVEALDECDDNYHDDDLRLARCSKNGEPLLEILKSELECGWSNASRQQVNILIMVAFVVSFLSLLV